MSKGTPVVPVRIADELMLEVDRAVRKRNDHSKAPPWSVSDFIRIAIREKLRKMERCRAPRGRCNTLSAS